MPWDRPRPALAQGELRVAFGRYVQWLQRRGAREYASFVERSPGAHWHVHAVIRAPWVDRLVAEATGLSWRELTECAARGAELGDDDPLAEALGGLRVAAVECGLAHHGFQLAPAYAPAALSDYLTKPMLDERGVLVSTVIGVRRATCTPGFFDSPELHPGTVPRVRRHATECNAPGDADVDDG